MMKEYFSIERKGATSPEELYIQFEEQSDFLAPDCCGGGITVDDIARMLSEGWISLDEDKIRFWING